MKDLLPTLFDRLCDDAPRQTSEFPAAYTLTPDGLREILRRDLGFLLNTTHIAQTVDFTAFSVAASSGLNFGVPPLVGGPLDVSRPDRVENFIRDAIRRFEPRLDPETIRVDFLTPDPKANRGHAPLFELRAHIRAQPYPVEFTVQSAVDFESGRITDLTRS